MTHHANPFFSLQHTNVKLKDVAAFSQSFQIFDDTPRFIGINTRGKPIPHQIPDPRIIKIQNKQSTTQSKKKKKFPIFPTSKKNAYEHTITR